MNERIINIWFEGNNLRVETTAGRVLSKPLEVFPALLEATAAQREAFYLYDEDRSIRWDSVDEDISLEDLEVNDIVNYDNAVNRLLSGFTITDIKALAEEIGMHWTKLARYRYGVWTPSSEELRLIEEGVGVLAT